MNQQDRPGIGSVAFFVDEVNAESVNARLEMREAIDLALMRAPVVLRPPVLDQFLQVSEIGAVLSPGIRNLVGQARILETSAQVDEHFVGHLNAERFDLFSHRTSAGATLTVSTSGFGLGITANC